MTTNELDRKIHEAMGLCWHEWGIGAVPDSFALKWHCHKCGAWGSYAEERDSRPADNPSYSSDWGAYGKFVEWLQKQELLDKWLTYMSDGKDRQHRYWHWGLCELKTLLSPLSGCQSFIEWWEGRKG